MTSRGNFYMQEEEEQKKKKQQPQEEEAFVLMLSWYATAASRLWARVIWRVRPPDLPVPDDGASLLEPLLLDRNG